MLIPQGWLGLRTPFTIFTPQYLIRTGSAIMTYGTGVPGVPGVPKKTKTKSAVLPTSLMSFLRYYIGGEGSSETPKSYYIIYGRPLMTIVFFKQTIPKIYSFYVGWSMTDCKLEPGHLPGMDEPPREEGGDPPSAPPRKNDQNRREVAGQNKGPNLNFLQ